MATKPARTEIGPLRAVAIVYDTDYTPMLRGIRAGVAGSLIVTNHAGVSLTFTNVAAGEVLWGNFQLISSSSTITEANLIGYQ